MAEPIVDRLKEEYSGKVQFKTIETDDYKTYAIYQEKYRIQTLPSVVILDSDGNVVLNEGGFSDESIFTRKLKDALEKASD